MFSGMMIRESIQANRKQKGYLKRARGVNYMLQTMSGLDMEKLQFWGKKGK